MGGGHPAGEGLERKVAAAIDRNGRKINRSYLDLGGMIRVSGRSVTVGHRPGSHGTECPRIHQNCPSIQPLRRAMIDDWGWSVSINSGEKFGLRSG